MYIDEVDHLCKVNPLLVADPDKIVDLELVADLGRGGLANLTPIGWGELVASLITMGWGEPVANLTPLDGENRPI
jgi:hypothetical protein